MSDEGKSRSRLVKKRAKLRPRGAGPDGSESNLVALDSLTDAAYLVDRDLRVISVNKRLKLWGEEIGFETDVTGRASVEAFPFAEEGVADQYRRVLMTGEMVVTEESFTVESRRYFTETRKIPVMDAGCVIRVITVVKDITTAKQAVEALRQAEQKYRTIYENAVEGMFQTTPDGRYISANPAFAGMFGYGSAEEMMSLITDIATQQYVHPEDRANLLRLYAENAFVEGFETEFFTKDGRRIWISINGRASIDADGRILYYDGTAQEVTDRKKAEEQLCEERETFSSILHNAPYGIFLHDPGGNLLFLNPEATNITGYAMEDIPRGKDWFANAYPDQEYQKLVFDTWKHGVSAKSVDKTFTVHCKDGTNKEIEFRSFKMADGKAVTMFKDITLRRRAEDEVRNSREELRTLTAHIQSVREVERTRIAREIHDELGQALTCIKMDLSEIREEYGPALSKKDMLLSKTQSLLELVDSTIDVVRRIAADLRPSILDDLGLVAAVEWFLQDFRKRTGIRCELKTPAKMIIHRDIATAAFRILQESLTNVARHARADEVKITLGKRKEELLLKIKDNGKGIVKSEISNQRSFGIMGMRERVLLFEGRISIVGRAGKGSAVTVFIPMKQTGRKNEEKLERSS